MQELTKEDWAQWRENDVTRRVFAMISERREEAIQYLAYGGGGGSISKKDITIGAINAYTHLLAMRFDEEKTDG